MARITIDYTPAVRQQAGIGRLTRELVEALGTLTTPSAHQWRLFTMGRMPNCPVLRPPFPTLNSPITDRWFHRLWFKAGLAIPVECFAGRCDLYHATDFVLPPTRPHAKTVLTVHDLSFERDPASAMPTLLAFLRKVVPASAKRASHIIADSYATAHDLTELYGIASEKITTIHSGVSKKFSPNPNQLTESATVRAQYNLGNAPFVLAVGTMQPRKNHLGLVRALAHISQSHSPSNPPNLVISGGKGWLYDNVLTEVRKLGLAERVKLIGYADDADLPALYRAAAVFAFPSFYEGFGLPLLEAMACGVPVITSNVSSLPEVVGDVGLTVDPHDTAALANAIHIALSDEHWRTQAIGRGLARAKQFTWERAATQLLHVYKNVLSA